MYAQYFQIASHMRLNAGLANQRAGQVSSPGYWRTSAHSVQKSQSSLPTESPLFTSVYPPKKPSRDRTIRARTNPWRFYERDRRVTP